MSESTLRTTALTSLHESLGAKLVDFAGWSMPVWYAGATDEHHAVRRSAGLFDLGHMGELFVEGPDAGAALDWALLLDASAMPVGRARYSMICDERGGIIDDLIVYRLDDQRWMVVANASNAPVVYGELVSRSAARQFDAVVSDGTDEWGLVAIQGPEAAAILSDIVEADLDAIRYYRIDELDVLGARSLVARTGYTGEDGFELFVPAAKACDVWAALSEAGGDRVRPCGLASRDTLRLEAGMPLYGNELTRETTPFDVGAERLVDLDRAAFASQGLTAAAASDRRHLVGLHVDGRRPARTGYGVHSGGAQVGHVTSGALSPTLERPIAMALVDAPLDEGATVTIDVRGSMIDACVVELPFYTRP